MLLFVTAKTFFKEKTEGRREVERPRLRWLEDTRLDLRDLIVKR